MQKPVSDECAQLIHSLIMAVDKCIIDDIRHRPESRDALLDQLDVLEKVRERLNVRLGPD
jgi:hypothetical protein